MITDEIKIRLTAFGVLLLIVAYWLTDSIAIPLFLTADFALRSFNLGKWSPLFRLASWVTGILKLKGKPVYMPAKRFAARIGLVFSVLITTFHLAGGSTATVLSIVLAFFAALESLAGFCAGCYLYNFLKRFAN